MPQDPTVWIILIIVSAMVIVVLGTLAIRSGRRLKITRSSLEIDKSGADAEAPAQPKITVAQGAQIKHTRAGDIAGIKGTEPAAADGDIDVARDAHIENSELGDIVGVKVDGKTDTEPRDSGRPHKP